MDHVGTDGTPLDFPLEICPKQKDMYKTKSRKQGESPLVWAQMKFQGPPETKSSSIVD